MFLVSTVASVTYEYLHMFLPFFTMTARLPHASSHAWGVELFSFQPCYFQPQLEVSAVTHLVLDAPSSLFVF